MTVQPMTTRFARLRRNPVLTDVVTGATVLVLGIVLLGLGVRAFAEFPVLIPATEDQLHWWHIVPLILACVATCVQTRYPLGVFFAITACFIVDMVLGLHMVVLVAWANTAYNAARYAAGKLFRWSLLGFGVLVFVWVYVFSGSISSALTALLQVAFTSMIAIWWGTEVRRGDQATEAERLKSLAARRREEHERQELLRRQRTELATQLHDTVSSHLSTIALYTAGTLDMPPDTKRDRNVLTEIRRSSLDALTDMRELIDVLRTFNTDHAGDTAVHEPLALPDTLRRLRSAGLELTLPKQTEAKLTDLFEQLGPQAAQLLLQIVQEALTNALKHGNGTASLQCDYTGDRLWCTMTNPLAPTQRHEPANTSALSGGLGLGAMAAAVHDAGGLFSAGATRDGKTHWRVNVELPAASSSPPSIRTTRTTP